MLSSGALEHQHRLPFKLASPLKNGFVSNSVNNPDMNSEEVCVCPQDPGVHKSTVSIHRYFLFVLFYAVLHTFL